MTVEAELSRASFEVTEACNVELCVTSSRKLGPNDQVEFQFPNSWSLVTGPSFTRGFQTDDPSEPHYCQVTAPGCGAVFEHAIVPSQLNHPGHGSRHGRCIMATVVSGSVPAGRRLVLCYANTFAPYVAEVETVWVRVKGETPDPLPTLTTTPGVAESTRLIVPSGVEPGERFEVLVVSLDRFDNTSSSRYEGRTLVRSDGLTVAHDLAFTGSARVPVQVDEPGVYRFVLDDVVSNAVRVGPGMRGPYWGDIHIHTKLSSDAQGVNPYRYAREVAGLDFGAAMDHWNSLGEGGYDILEKWAAADHEPGRFVTVLGDERNPTKLTGHHNLYFRDLEQFRAHRALAEHSGEASAEAEADAMAGLDPERAMLIPHHTGISFGNLRRGSLGAAVDWDAWSGPDALRPVMEIYSHHGQSELYCPQHCLAYEFNRTRNPERRGNSSTPGPHYAQDYWKAGRRLGCLASSDEHSGQGGRRHGGIAAVFADELTREAVFDAIRARRCYATTGEHILMEFMVDGVAMGGSATRPQGSTVGLSLKAWGTALLLHVEILRFRFGQDEAFVPILSVAPRHDSGAQHIGAQGPQPETLDAAYELDDEVTGPCMYYARVTQEPLGWPGMAWSSPVWIDTE